jgi:flagellar basal body-associated protein FliL
MPRRDQRDANFDAPATTSNWVMTSFLVVFISLIAGGAGFIMPHVISAGATTNITWETLTTGHDSRKKPKHRTSGKQPVSIPFGEAVVNLAEERLTRHLHVRITLLVHGADEELIETVLETNRPVLMNWLISYLSDKSLEEVRGAAGVNRARRDIQDRFNSLLFADGSEKVRDILFEEFTVR